MAVRSGVQWKPSYEHSESDRQFQVREFCEREVVSIVFVHYMVPVQIRIWYMFGHITALTEIEEDLNHNSKKNYQIYGGRSKDGDGVGTPYVARLG